MKFALPFVSRKKLEDTQRRKEAEQAYLLKQLADSNRANVKLRAQLAAQAAEAAAE